MEDRLVIGEAVALDVRPTPFALRIAGGVIDLLVYGLGTIGAILLLSVTLGLAGADTATATSTLLVTVVVGLVLAPMLVEGLSGGRSLGRLAVGARIVRDDGGPVTMRHAFIRALMGFVEIYSTLGGLATIVALLSTRTKRLGDMIAGTYSRHERFPMPRPLELVIAPPLTGWAATADVARMPDPLARRIAHFLRQSPGMQPASRERLAAGLLAEAAAYVHPLPHAPADALLTAIAVLRREREAVALQRQAEVVARLPLGAPHGFPER